MSLELDEVVQDVSDDALELAAGSAQGGPAPSCSGCWGDVAQGVPVTHNL